MESYRWDEQKNRKLIAERGISFEAIVSCLEEGNILAIMPGKGTYSHQKQFIIQVHRYVYIVPFVEEQEGVFLKTIIPSRKMTRLYLFGEST